MQLIWKAAVGGAGALAAAWLFALSTPHWLTAKHEAAVDVTDKALIEKASMSPMRETALRAIRLREARRLRAGLACRRRLARFIPRTSRQTAKPVSVATAMPTSSAPYGRGASG